MSWMISRNSQVTLLYNYPCEIPKSGAADVGVCALQQSLAFLQDRGEMADEDLL
jgi:hypothetical protein